MFQNSVDLVETVELSLLELSDLVKDIDLQNTALSFRKSFEVLLITVNKT